MPTSPSQTKHPRLLALAWPIFVEQGLRVLIGTVDVFMVSHIGDDAVAGLGVANQIVFLFITVFAFVAIGSSVVITHHLGARDREGADVIARNAIAVNTWIGMAVSIGVFCLAGQLLSLMQLTEAPASYALPFLTLMGGTLFLESMNISIAAVLRAHSHTRDAMLVAAGQNILNVIGNCVLLFGLLGFPKLGVLGVALSSVFSRLVSCVALWWLLEYRTKARLGLRDFFRIRWDMLKRILHIGLPAAGENICWWLAFIVVTSFIARMGGHNLAAQNYTMNIIRWVILMSVSIGLGTEIVIGHLVGAGAFEEAYRQLLKSLGIGFVCALIGAAILALASPYLIGMFTQDPVIIASSVFLIRLGFLLEPGRVFNIVVINSLRATGDARFPLMMGIISMWGVWVPLAWLLGLKLGLGLPGVWIAMICDEWLRGIMMYRRWKQRHWIGHAIKSRESVIGGATEGL